MNIEPFYLSVIVPALNEEKIISQTVSKLVLACDWICRGPSGYEIIVVDNGSTDQTGPIVKAWAESTRQVRYKYIPKRGKGLAVRMGMLAARGRYRYMCDADLSTPPSEIARFLDMAMAYDVVIGSRVLGGDVVMPGKRRLIGRMFHRLACGLTGPVTDTQCGFKMLRGYVAESLFETMQVDGMAFDVELLYLARRAGYSLAELDVPWVHRADSRVDLVRDGWQMAVDVAKIPLMHISDRTQKVPA